MEDETNPKVINLEKILGEVSARRESMINIKDIANITTFSSCWGVQSPTVANTIRSELENAYYWVRQGIRGNIKKKDSPYSSAEVAAQRMSDYLNFLGYSEAESKKMFESIHEVCTYSSYVSPNKKIKPFRKKK